MKHTGIPPLTRFNFHIWFMNSILSKKKIFFKNKCSHSHRRCNRWFMLEFSRVLTHPIWRFRRKTHLLDAFLQNLNSGASPFPLTIIFNPLPMGDLLDGCFQIYKGRKQIYKTKSQSNFYNVNNWELMSR